MLKDTFITDFLNGKAELKDIDDYVERWHNSDIKEPLHEYLGLTIKEYEDFVIRGDDALKDAVKNRLPQTGKRYMRSLTDKEKNEYDQMVRGARQLSLSDVLRDLKKESKKFNEENHDDLRRPSGKSV